MKNTALVLFSYKSHKHGYIENLFSRLSESATGQNVSLERGSLKELHISVTDGKLQVDDAMTGKSLNDFAVIYFELWYKCPQQALAAATYCERQNIPYFSNELSRLIPDTKVGEIAILADSGISIPNTFTSSNAQLKKHFTVGSDIPFTYPFILKAADGYGGKTNFLVKNRKQLVEVLKSHKGITFIAQEYIPNDRDYRCLVLDGKVELVLERKRQDESTHLNNTSAGAEGRLVDVSTLPKLAIKDVVAAAERIGRTQFAGVDMIINCQTGQHYILEVNQTPQIEIGAEVDAKMNALLSFMKKLGGQRW